MAAIAALRLDDYMLYAHRGVAYWVARGIPLEARYYAISPARKATPTRDMAA